MKNAALISDRTIDHVEKRMILHHVEEVVDLEGVVVEAWITTVMMHHLLNVLDGTMMDLCREAEVVFAAAEVVGI